MMEDNTDQPQIQVPMTDLRILKLKSGELVIGKPVGLIKTKDEQYTLSIIIEFPMQYTIMNQFTPMGVKELLMMRSWIPYAMNINQDIPLEDILTQSVPSDKLIEQYNKTKEQTLNPPSQKEMTNMEKQKMFLVGMIQDMDDDDFEEFLDETGIEMVEENPPKQNKDDKKSDDNDEEDEDEDATETMKQHIDELIFLEDQDKTKDNEFGNRWTDWSPDIRDYLNGETEKE
jgi:hypothetical protein